ncbi:MAG: phosphate signaling complex protein PhoU [Candidatus Cloacimonetes bacterium]|nr:phosphate signaling complex protein PhoU [Candidatus Cloacimonadota bacterium]
MVHLFREMERLKRKIVNLSDAVESSLKDAVRAIENRDADLAAMVIRQDRGIDAMEVEVEEECLKMLALYQPVANDLRFIVAMLKVNNDLERIGDLAANIAKNALYMMKRPRPDLHPRVNFQEVSLRVLEMLKTALDALVNMDAALARKVCDDDDVVDDLVSNMLNEIKGELKRTPQHTDMLVSYINVFNHFERIGDLATNIAEDSIYLISGVIVRHGQLADKGDEG